MATIWTIEAVEYDAESEDVLAIHWRATTTINGISSDEYGSHLIDSAAEGYKPIKASSLTEAESLALVKDAVDQDAVEARIAEAISQKVTPPVVVDLPWA